MSGVLSQFRPASLSADSTSRTFVDGSSGLSEPNGVTIDSRTDLIGDASRLVDRPHVSKFAMSDTAFDDNDAPRQKGLSVTVTAPSVVAEMANANGAYSQDGTRL